MGGGTGSLSSCVIVGTVYRGVPPLGFTCWKVTTCGSFTGDVLLSVMSLIVLCGVTNVSLACWFSTIFANRFFLICLT